MTGLTGQTSLGATGAQIAAGAGNSLVFTAPVAFAAAMTTDPLDNTATATDLLSGATGSGTDSDARSPQVSLAVTKTDGSATYTPGGTATYTVTVTDNGLTDALNVSVADTLPAGVTLTGDVGCTANAGAQLRHRDGKHGTDELQRHRCDDRRGRRQLAHVHGAGRLRLRFTGRSAGECRDHE